MAAPLSDRLPAISDLEARARRRVPRFAWEYLDAGTGSDETRDRNRAAMREVQFTPRLLRGELQPDISTNLFGVEHSAPFGIAPMGLPALIWPGADQALVDVARRRRVPYTASTVGTETLEVVGPGTGGMGWFQLYPPRDAARRADLLDRAKRAGFAALVVTADVPAPSRRERQRKSGITNPPRIGPRMLAQSARCPAWSLAMLRSGLPRFKVIEPYVDHRSISNTGGFIGKHFGGTLSWQYLADVRGLWDGPLIVKGIQHPDDARRCVDAGADAIQVSNHGGRQFDGSPAAITLLRPVVEAVGDVPVLFDGGVRSGLDIARALALGASFVLCGRAWLYGLGALGLAGPDHVYDILREDLENAMHQLGCASTAELSARLV